MNKQKSLTRLYYKPTDNFSVRLALMAFLFSLAGCAASLAPKFNQTIIDDLSAATTHVFQLLANASGGTSNANFDARSEMYNTVIGEMEALELEIEARPMPNNKTVNKIIEKANSRLQSKGGTLITANTTAPSATAIQKIIDNLTVMKKTDQLQGLKATEVNAFKGDIKLYLDQALTYESFLNN